MFVWEGITLLLLNKVSHSVVLVGFSVDKLLKEETHLKTTLYEVFRTIQGSSFPAQCQNKTSKIWNSFLMDGKVQDEKVQNFFEALRLREILSSKVIWRVGFRLWLCNVLSALSGNISSAIQSSSCRGTHSLQEQTLCLQPPPSHSPASHGLWTVTVVSYIMFNHQKGRPFIGCRSQVDNMYSIGHIPLGLTWVMWSPDSKIPAPWMSLIKSCVFNPKTHEGESNMRSASLISAAIALSEPIPQCYTGLSAQHSHLHDQESNCWACSAVIMQFVWFSICGWQLTLCMCVNMCFFAARVWGNNEELSRCTIILSVNLESVKEKF